MSSVMKLACGPESKRARSLITYPKEFRIVTGDVKKNSVYLIVSTKVPPSKLRGRIYFAGS